MKRGIALLALAFAGCSPPDGKGVLAVTVDSQALVPSVSALRVTVAVGSKISMASTFPLTSKPAIPPAQTLALRYTPDVKGMATVNVEALDDQQMVIAQGKGTADLQPSRQVDCRVTLKSASWEPQDIMTKGNVYGLWGIDKTVYAVGAGGLVLKTNTDGATWDSVRGIGVVTDLWRMWGSAADDLYIVGNSGTILHSTNGIQWEKQGTPNNLILYGIWGSGPNDVYAAGEGPTMLHTVDHGKTWVPENVSSASGIYAVFGFAADNVYAVGENGALLKRTVGPSGDDGGVADGGMGGVMWVPLSSGVTPHLDQMWGSGPNDVYIVGDSGTLLHSIDGGKTWTAEALGLTHENLYSVWGIGADHVYVVGNAGGILHKQAGRWALEPSGTTESFYAAWAGDATTVFAGGTNGVLLRRR
jgi:photosystem II stability/assembly factor-like uncharacterized protein